MTERDDERPREEPDPGQVADAPGAQAFFDRGDRKMHLDQLRHLSQWSRRILLVTGPRGVGKSALYRQLSASLEPRAKAARINGTLVGGTREVLNAMVQGFGLAAPADADTQLLRQLVAEHAREQEDSDRFCVVLIDDAELLEFRALEQLVALVHGSPMRLVLFGEVRLVPAVERAADAARVGWHEIRLTGFNQDDARTYLAWRFRQQGLEEEFPFTDAQVREIVRLSEGLPGRIDQMANVLLARIQSAGSGPSGYRFPPLHRAILAVLVVVVAFLYLIWRPEERAPETVRLSDPPSAPAVPSAAPPVTRAPAVTPDAVAEPGAGDPAAPPALAGAEAESPRAAGAAADPAAGVDAGAAPESADDAAPGMVLGEAPQSAAEAATSAPPAAAPEETDVPTRTGAGAAAGTADAAAPGDAAERVDVAPPEDADGPRDAVWIMRQPADGYTLQLVSFSTAERADEYLSEQDRPERFARYRLQRDGRILHVVIYGSFADRAAAQQAAAELPGSVGSVQPWIRTFAQIQSGVRTALQR